MSTHAPASETTGNMPMLPAPGELKEPATFLADIYRLAAGQEDAAMDMIFDHVNALLMAARFDQCDQLLRLIDLGKLPTVLLISFLTITAAAKDKLAERARFFDRAKGEVVRQRGAEAAQRLLVGLEEAMHAERLKRLPEKVPYVAVGVCRTPYGNTHAGVVHRQPDGDLRFLEQAWHHDTRNDPFTDTIRFSNGVCLCAVLEAEPDRARNLAGLCRFIARTGQMFAYALRHDSDATFEETTGQLVMPNGKGLNCSTFVLIVFHAARIPLVDLSDWPARDEDAAVHANLLALLERTGASAEHLEAVRGEIGCARVRPEEVAGACLFDTLPVHFSDAEPGGRAVLDALDALKP